MDNIRTATGYAGVQALAIKTGDGTADIVSSTNPVPVFSTSASNQGSGVTPLAGTTSTSGTVGPFTPALNRSINLTLAGTFSGSVQLLRSVDGGTTKLPLTVAGQAYGTYTAPANEPVWSESESGATYYLAITLSSGSLAYRLAH